MSEPTERNLRDVPRTERVAGPGVPLTERAQPPHAPQDATFGQGWLHLQLPPELESRFATDGREIARGGEAIIFPVTSRKDGKQLVLKLYHPGVAPDLDVLGLVRDQLDRAHVIGVEEFGEAGGLFYEVLERVSYGTLGELREGASGAVAEARVEEILVELESALRHIHSFHVVHRDLTPSNVLVRTEQPLDLVLTDFGVSRSLELSRLYTRGSGTVHYMSPEQLGEHGMVQRATDYWALGLILAELLTGKHPYAVVAEEQVPVFLATKTIPLRGLSARWEKLCRGLLIQDPDLRWGADEIDKWIVDWESLPNPTNAVRTERVRAEDEIAYRLEGRDYFGPEEWARGFAENWTESLRRWGRGRIQEWFAENVRDDQDLLSFVDALDADADLTHESRLSSLIARLDPRQPPIFSGQALTQDNLRGAARRVLQGVEEAREFLDSVFHMQILQRHAVVTRDVAGGQLAESWRSAVNAYSSALERLRGSGVPGWAGIDPSILHATTLLWLLDEAFASQISTEIALVADKVDGLVPWFPSVSVIEGLPPGECVLMWELRRSAQGVGDILRRSALRAERYLSPSAARVAGRAAVPRALVGTWVRTVALVLALTAAMLLVLVWQRRQEAGLTPNHFFPSRLAAGSGISASTPAPGLLVLTVLPPRGWTDTGLQIYAGETLAWSLTDPTYRWGSAVRGHRQTVSSDGALIQGRLQTPRQGDLQRAGEYPAPDLPIGAFLGRVGTDAPFVLRTTADAKIVRPSSWTQFVRPDRSGAPVSVAFNWPVSNRKSASDPVTVIFRVTH